MVEAMDEAVGKVLKQLDESGLADNTIVIFTSDNGGLSTSEGSPTSNLPLRGGKGWIYEGGIREPWIVRYPGITKAGSVSNEPISSIDLFPTIANAAKVEINHEIDGVDLLPALEGKSLDRRCVVLATTRTTAIKVVFPVERFESATTSWLSDTKTVRVHLYNLTDDIGEQTDLAESQPEKTQELRDALHAWYKTVDAKFLRRKKDGPSPWRPAD